MSDYKTNSYSDDDFRSVLDQIEQLEAEKVSIMATAAGECGGIAKKVKKIKDEARNDLSIPLSVLNATLKTRKLERKIDEIAQGIDEDLIEVFEDAIGQFSMFVPEPGEKAEPASAVAAKRAKAKADENHDREQAEGEDVLKDLVH